MLLPESSSCAGDLGAAGSGMCGRGGRRGVECMGGRMGGTAPCMGAYMGRPGKKGRPACSVGFGMLRSMASCISDYKHNIIVSHTCTVHVHVHDAVLRW